MPQKRIKITMLVAVEYDMNETCQSIANSAKVGFLSVYPHGFMRVDQCIGRWTSMSADSKNPGKVKT